MVAKQRKEKAQEKEMNKYEFKPKGIMPAPKETTPTRRSNSRNSDLASGLQFMMPMSNTARNSLNPLMAS